MTPRLIRLTLTANDNIAAVNAAYISLMIQNPTSTLVWLGAPIGDHPDITVRESQSEILRLIREHDAQPTKEQP